MQTTRKVYHGVVDTLMVRIVADTSERISRDSEISEPNAIMRAIGEYESARNLSVCLNAWRQLKDSVAVELSHRRMLNRIGAVA